MKKFLFLKIFFFSAGLSNAQLKLINTDLVNNDSAIIFRNVLNHFELSGKNIPGLNLLSMEGGHIIRSSNSTFFVNDIHADTVSIEVAKMVNNKRKLLCTKILRAVDLEKPTVNLVKENDTTYLNGQVMNWTRFEVKFNNPNYNGKWEVAHFELSIFDSAGNIFMPSTFISGKYLTKKYNDIILALAPGYKIVFSQIILKYPDGDYSKYDDLTMIK